MEYAEIGYSAAGIIYFNNGLYHPQERRPSRRAEFHDGARPRGPRDGMKAIVVVPTYNEIENLERIVGLIREQPGGFHILVVDDNSPDGTGRRADELSRQYAGEVQVLHRERKEGLGRAYVAGFGHALKMPEYDVIIQMDADLSHDPSYLPAFMQALEKYDMVLGSRYLHGVNVVNWDFKRLLLSKGASLYVKMIT